GRRAGQSAARQPGRHGLDPREAQGLRGRAGIADLERDELTLNRLSIPFVPAEALGHAHVSGSPTDTLHEWRRCAPDGSLPPCGGGKGRGVGDEAPSARLVSCKESRTTVGCICSIAATNRQQRCCTPLPVPPPQGGRERCGTALPQPHTAF